MSGVWNPKHKIACGYYVQKPPAETETHEAHRIYANLRDAILQHQITPGSKICHGIGRGFLADTPKYCLTNEVKLSKPLNHEYIFDDFEGKTQLAVFSQGVLVDQQPYSQLN